MPKLLNDTKREDLIAPRRKTLTVSVGGILIGGAHPLVVQSMTSTDTRNVPATLRQIRGLKQAGCELVRVAVPDQGALEGLAEIVSKSSLPVIGDIHFNYRLALEAVKAGVAGIRINPGNIGGTRKIREVIAAARDRGVCIRIGVNAGSLEKDLLPYPPGRQAEAMVTSALRHIAVFEQSDFKNLKISLKSSNVLQTVRAYRLLAGQVPYPFHLGITEAGSLISGTVKSALGLGLLLVQGLGDTLRVSLTAAPQEEVRVAYQILQALGLRQRGIELISCPTCGRCQINLMALVKKVERAVRQVSAPLKVAIMGCIVNGPGEAREADIGIAGGKGTGLLFAGGRRLRKVPEQQLVPVLLEEIENLVKRKG